jgi:hypothetical protein
MREASSRGAMCAAGGFHRPAAVTRDHGRSRAITGGHARSRAVTRDHARSRAITRAASHTASCQTTTRRDHFVSEPYARDQDRPVRCTSY